MLCQPAVDVSAHNQRSVENGLKYSYQTTGGKWMKDGVTDGNKINEIKKKKKIRGSADFSVLRNES